MGEATAISWTHDTFNPWWGCVRVSDECTHCYAEAMAKRTGHGVWGKTAPRRVIGDHTWHDPHRWARRALDDGRPRLVFCASMADVFEAVPQSAPMVDHKGVVVPGRNVVTERRRLWQLIEDTPELRWQLLTKRPENIMAMVPPSWTQDEWPAHVWIGTTVGTQRSAETRIPALLEVPAAVRFLSCEPLLEPVNLSRWLYRRPGVHWVIAGGESGAGHRAMDRDWARGLRDQCRSADVPFWYKQGGGITSATGGVKLPNGEVVHELDGHVIHQYPRAYQAELDACA